MESRTKKFQLDFEDMQSKLRSQKENELRELREKYERQIQDNK